MQYRGTRLYELVQSGRGRYTNLAEKMKKYRKVRKNSSDKPYRIESLYQDGHNITLSTLSALIKETGKSIDFFIDFEPWELSAGVRTDVSGSGNIVNSSVGNDVAQRVEHLAEIIRLKDEIIREKERVITLKDSEIEQWKKRYDDLIKLAQENRSDKNRT